MSSQNRSAPASPITVDAFKDLLRTPEMRTELQRVLLASARLVLVRSRLVSKQLTKVK